MPITRRDFFVKTIQGLAVVAAPVALGAFLESCKSNVTGPTGASLQTVQGTLTNGIVSVNIDSSSPLYNTGGVATVKYSSGSLLVDHPSANVYNALSAICTHQGCSVDNYDSSTSNFVCTCHNSRFAVDGGVVTGPASAPLPKYKTEFANGQLKITL